jgi:hypothetical protein
MRNIFGLLCALLLILLTGCASLTAAPPPGASEQEVIAMLGQPTNRYQDGATQILEYAWGPAGQQTYMARFDNDGRLASYEQVLTTQKFSTIKIGETTKEIILLTFGRPTEISYLTLPQLEVWSYRYKENNVWDSMMHVHFDHAGIVRKVQNGPDPRYEDHDRFSRLFFWR